MGAQLTTPAAEVNIPFLLATLESFYWYQRGEDACPHEMTVSLRLAPDDAVRRRLEPAAPPLPGLLDACARFGRAFRPTGVGNKGIMHSHRAARVCVCVCVCVW
jgi:hypothetical protein